MRGWWGGYITDEPKYVPSLHQYSGFSHLGSGFICICRPSAKADYLSVCFPPLLNWNNLCYFDRLKYGDFRSEKLPKIPVAILGEFLN